MGKSRRYSFFLTIGVSSGGNVYAVDDTGAVLSSGSSNVSDSGSTSASTTESSLDNGDVATWETGTNPENNSEFTGPIDEEINLNQTPWYEDPSLFSNQLIKNVQFDENYNATELPLRQSRAWWNSNSFFGTVKASGLGYVSIGPAFSTWDLGPAGTDKWLQPQAILMAAQNSIFATNARIDDLRGGVERMDVRVNTSLSSLASQISSLRTDATNGDNSIRSALATLRTDATNGDIAANKRIDSLDVKIVSTQKTLDEAKASVANAHSRISSVDTKLVSTQGIVTSIQDGLAQLRLDSSVTDAQIKDSVKNANARIDSVDKKLVTTQGVVSGLTDGLAQLRKDASVTDAEIKDSVKNVNTRVDSVDTKLVSTQGLVSSLADGLAQLRLDATHTDGNLQSQIDDLKSRYSYVIGKNLNDMTKPGQYLVSGQTNGPTTVWGQLIVTGSMTNNGRIYQEFIQDNNSSKWERRYYNGVWSPWVETTFKKSDLTALDTKISNEAKAREAKDNSQQNEINTLGTWKNVQNAWNVSQENEISEIKKSIANLGSGWSDIGIIAAIIGIHDAWQSTDYATSNVLEGDGAIVKLAKSQTKRIETMLSSILNAFKKDGIFWLAWKSMLPELGAVITKCLDTSTPGTPLYAFRYSMTAGFTDLQEAVKYGFEKVRDNQLTTITNQGTILSVLEEIRDNTAIITQWLKKIYEKPGSTFIQTPFDYERLQKMLDGLSFGEIVNEAGTNIWDFLTELIRSLGTVLSTAIGEVSKSLGEILDFLDGLLDKLIHLIVPENMDFMENKVDGLSSDFKMKFSFVFNWIDTFKGLLGNQSTFKDFKLNMGGMFSGEVNIPLSFLNQIAPLVRPLITGFVLLDFLIDMYKWFHTRGEVIE